MSKYTISLQNIETLTSHENLVNFFTNYELSDFLSQKEIETIQKRGVWTKEKLAEKIVEHYYFSEIRFWNYWNV